MDTARPWPRRANRSPRGLRRTRTRARLQRTRTRARLQRTSTRARLRRTRARLQRTRARLQRTSTRARLRRTRARLRRTRARLRAPAPAPGPGYGAPGASGYSQTGAWGWAPKPGIIPLRPLSISDLLSGSFAALRMNPKVLFGFTLIVLTIVGVLSSLVSIFPAYSLMSASEYGGILRLPPMTSPVPCPWPLCQRSWATPSC